MFAECLLSRPTGEKFGAWLSGCEEDWGREMEVPLPPALKQKVGGGFPIAFVSPTADEVRQHANRILTELKLSEQMELMREVMGEAQRNGRGAVGLKHVLNALERQEVQTLLLMRDLKAEAVECPNCRHLDTRMVKNCAVCGHETRELSDVSDSLVDLALRNGAEIRFIDGDPDLEKAGRVAALLRFRADQNTTEKMAV